MISAKLKGLEQTKKYLEEQMKSLIGTKVSVHAKANGKGKIEIEYYSPDDLERIYELLMTIQHN